jgi:transketolase
MLTTQTASPKKMLNPRVAYGEELLALAAKNSRIVALDADLCKSTMTVLMQDKSPDNFVEMGIAEQNMASTAAGLALAGMIPFINSFAVFVTGRCYDQIRQAICLPRLNVKVMGSSAGLSDFGDGSTHQSVEDMSLMRSIPNMTVLSPCDALEVRKAVRAMVEYDGPVYLRVSRNDMPTLTEESTPFSIGNLLRLAEGDDVAILATGVMAAEALEARALLEAMQISARVVNVSTLKPLSTEAVLEQVAGVKCVVTAEEHSVIGGLGSAVASALRRNRIPIDFVGIQDSFGISAMSHRELLVHYGLTAQAIANAAKDLLWSVTGRSAELTSPKAA